MSDEPASSATDTDASADDEKPGASAPFHSFWMGGFEGADHINGSGLPLDMAVQSGHIATLDEDYRLAAALGLRTIRESIGWRLAEPRPGEFDFVRALHIAATARRHRLQVLWTLMHYGTPSDVSLLDDSLIKRFARFAAAAAHALAPWHDSALGPPVYTLINEISFVAWAASATGLLYPYGSGVRRSGDTETSGHEIKRRLVRAVLAAVATVREVDPRARFLHVDPAVHVVAPRDQPELAPLAERIASYQWHAWDMIAGRLEPELGGYADALDLVGVNYYHSGQWEAGSERRLSWHERDERRRPLSALLHDNWQRYRRPLIIAETSHVGTGRAAWLSEVTAELDKTRRRGLPVQGICLYPLADRPDWEDPTRWHNSGLWDRGESTTPDQPTPQGLPPRRLSTVYASVLQAWQAVLPTPPTGRTPMNTLIVFSHLRWEFVYQRPQHLMSRLAEHYHVLFFEEPLHAEGEPRLDVQPQLPNVDVLRPYTPLDAPGFHDDQLPILRSLLTDYLREAGIESYLVWFYTPLALPLISRLHPDVVVYDCMDELSAFKNAPRQLRQRETALLKISHLVLTGGPSLFEAKRHLHRNVHCLPSAVDAKHFAPEQLDADSDMALHAKRLSSGIGSPRLGYCGVIDERLDVALITAVARMRPDWHFVMVGPVVKIDPAILPRLPNIHWLGMQPYASLPHLIASWNVCLIPFARNESTRFVSPTKTLEYLAACKPVVSTTIRDVVALYGNVVRIADTPETFVACCEHAMNETTDEHERRQFEMLGEVSRFSWDKSVEAIRALIERLEPEASPGNALSALSGPSADEKPSMAIPTVCVSSNRARRALRHVVVGAGPTGLSAAYHLGLAGAAEETLLVERDSRVGGWCRSIEQGGFTFDFAGHIMFSSDPYVIGLYDLLLGANQHWQDREAWIYSKNVYTRYPFQGALHGLPPEVLKECLVGAIEARFGPLSGNESPRPREAPQNFEEFIHSVWGRGIAKHFAVPYNEKLWTVPLAEMETSWLGNRVPMPDLEQMIEGALEPVPKPMGPNARFGYPLRGGFQALMDAFLPHLSCELALNTSLLQVSPSQHSVWLDDGRRVEFESLISTMPLPALVRCCGDEAPAEVRAAAAALRPVSVRCVNLGIGRANLTEKHWIYYPEDTVFHRIFVQGNASPHCSPPNGCGLICEISYSPSKPLPCDGEALLQRVIEDCRRVGIIRADDPILVSNQVDLPCAYVVYDHARAASVALIREWLAGFGILLAGRYSEWEYYNSDHAFSAGKKAAETILAADPARRIAS